MAGLKTLEEKARAKDEAHKQKVQEEVERRKAQETDLSRGEPVWFSRRIVDGHLHHWALFTHGKKYELRLPSREKYKDMLPNGRFVGSVVPSFKYEAKIVPWSLKDEMMRQREENLADEGKPYAQDYYICQIGWTKLNEQQVDEACAAISASFGVYVLGFNDCQTFLKQFARRIIKVPEDCALDYHWFAENVETQYHQLQLIPADENIKAFQTWKHVAIWGSAIGLAGAVYSMNDSTSYQSEEPMVAAPQDNGNQASGGDDEGCCDCDCSGC